MHTIVVVGTGVAALTSCGETSRRPHTPSNPQAARGGQAGDADAGSTASEAGAVTFGGGATSLGGAAPLAMAWQRAVVRPTPLGSTIATAAPNGSS